MATTLVPESVVGDDHSPVAPIDVKARPGKRLFDLALALPLAVLTAPVMLALAAGSAIAFRANPFFVQQRVGKGGQLFSFVKIRSLPAHAPKYADKYEILHVENNRWGKFLRKSHLDELPQLWLVVAGSMSMVGPRPEMPELSASFDPEFVQARLTVRPGITGLWQVSPASAKLIGEHPEYDLHYVQHQTLRLDLWVLFATVLVVFGKQKAWCLERVPRWTGSRRMMEAAAA